MTSVHIISAALTVNLSDSKFTSGWCFGTLFLFAIQMGISCHPNWRTHIFERGFSTISHELVPLCFHNRALPLPLLECLELPIMKDKGTPWTVAFPSSVIWFWFQVGLGKSHYLEIMVKLPNISPFEGKCWTQDPGWWFGTCFIFPYIWRSIPNWLSYFSGG